MLCQYRSVYLQLEASFIETETEKISYTNTCWWRHNTQHNDAQRNVTQCICRVLFMLGVTIKSIVLNVMPACCLYACAISLFFLDIYEQK